MACPATTTPSSACAPRAPADPTGSGVAAEPARERPVCLLAKYQRKDHYHQRAKREGHRSRAVYKLEELDRRQRLLRKGLRVADLGCWPGGWLDWIAGRVGPSGRVVGVDLAAVDPPPAAPHAEALVGDLEEPATSDRLREALGGPCDLLVCDAAPKLTGVREADRANEERLLEAVEAAIPRLLRSGGDAVVKLLEGPEARAVAKRIGRGFARAATTRLAATRKGSSEQYLVARGYRGPGER